MSKKFKEWTDSHGIKLDLIPEGAHHMLGLLERNHQVRREQLATYAQTFPEDHLGKALRITAAQRNRLRNVGGFSPTGLVLGKVPRLPATLADEDFKLSEHAAVTDKGSEYQADMLRRAEAAAAFLKANTSIAVRASLLAR